MNSKPPRPSDNRPPRPSDNRPPRPSDGKSKPGKGPMFKDRREHRIELRQKTAALKEELNELKAIETDDEAKKTEIQEAISELRILLKQCDMEKEAIESFNHTQFLNNVKASDAGQGRFKDEATGNTRFFGHLKGGAPKTVGSENEAPETKATDPLIKPLPAVDTTKQDPLLESSESSEGEESSETSEPDTPPTPFQLPPNTIV